MLERCRANELRKAESRRSKSLNHRKRLEAKRTPPSRTFQMKRYGENYLSKYSYSWFHAMPLWFLDQPCEHSRRGWRPEH